MSSNYFKAHLNRLVLKNKNLFKFLFLNSHLRYLEQKELSVNVNTISICLLFVQRQFFFFKYFEKMQSRNSLEGRWGRFPEWNTSLSLSKWNKNKILNSFPKTPKSTEIFSRNCLFWQSWFSSYFGKSNLGLGVAVSLSLSFFGQKSSWFQCFRVGGLMGPILPNLFCRNKIHS